MGVRILSGVTTAALAVSLAQPTDVVKVRLQAGARSSQYRSVQVSTGQYRSVQVSTSQYKSVQVSTGQYRSVQVSTGQYSQYKLVQVSTGQYKSVQVSTGHTCQGMSVVCSLYNRML